MHTKTTRARGKVRAQYRWAYATSTLLPLQEIGQNRHEKGGWAYNTSWACNTYSTVLANRLTSRVHGNTRRLPAHALSLDDRHNIVQYIRNYAEVNAILLPGRVPGYKHDDVQLLPAAATKRQVWMMFTGYSGAHSDVCSIMSGLEAFPPKGAHHKASKRPLLGVPEKHHHHACCQSARGGKIHRKHDNCSKYKRQRRDTHHTLYVHVLNGLDTEDNRCTCTLVRLDMNLIRGLDMI